MTNHEWLKAMSAKEVAEFINKAMGCEMPEGFPSENTCSLCNLTDCLGCIVGWLSEEQKETGTEPTKEQVNHPSHYNREGALECIDEMLTLYTKEEVMAFCKLNAHKYRYRAGQKEDGMKDLKKSDWYIKKYKALKDDKSNLNSFAIKGNDYPISLCVDRGV